MEHDKDDKKAVEQPKKADDTGGVHISGHIRIFDPETNEDFVNKRDDE